MFSYLLFQIIDSAWPLCLDAYIVVMSSWIIDRIIDQELQLIELFIELNVPFEIFNIGFGVSFFDVKYGLIIYPRSFFNAPTPPPTKVIDFALHRSRSH